MARLSRREFLENSMLAAAAAVTAPTLPLLAAEKQSDSPNEKLRVAIVGINGRGTEHRDAWLRRKDCEIVAICDVDADVGAKKGVNHVHEKSGKAPAFYQDTRKLIEAASTYDIVSIATPNHWHALAAIWALDAGKDVYVEKPVSHNVWEGRKIVDHARKANLICQTGTQCRSMGGTIEAIEYVQSGKIGAVKLARGLCYKGRPSIGARGEYQVPGSVDYDVWCGPAPKQALTRPKFHYDWHWQWDYGNGDLGNQGIHQMDIARWGLGVSDIGQSVISYGGRFGYTDAGETANTQVSIHNYGDKTLVFEVRGLKTERYKGAGVGVIFEGSEGYVVLSSYDSGSAFDKAGNKVKDFKAGGDHFDNFVQAVRSRKASDLHADILEGHLSSALCHLGNISYRLGEPTAVGDVQKALESVPSSDANLETFERVKSHLADNNVDVNSLQIKLGAMLTIDPQTEQFMGGMAGMANPMLSRDYRKGFEVA